MSGTKTKTVNRARSGSTRKPAKRPSLGRRLLQVFFSSASALAMFAGNFIVRNPVLTGGATAFAVVMGFVSANALWYQPEAHNAVFFKTRTDFVFKATPRAYLPGTAPEHKQEATENVQPVETPTQSQTETAEISPDRLQLTGSIDEMLPALAPNADVEIARLQQRLLTLGIYQGAVDGFTGPQTREAIERWQALQKKVGAPAQNGAVAAPKEDDVAKLIDTAVPTPRPQPAVLKVETPAKRAPDLASLESKPAQPKKQPVELAAFQPQAKISSQDIVRVQAGLKAFGNEMVSVDGVPGKSTQDAIREFQKLFKLPVTGEVDAALISKMREIGLIS
ncbi:peptidoglycan-binding domain-containing protein [Brucella pseudogrignonensis]|uniref:Peptidoglycan hydrolase-like protein with peptidoglycan-binding domain n=1 Tax=Brucella pseudogrignonensis TaxID=419475 RepID=A0ABU1M6L3_9HYPH|nr:peptidoglycan-binding domain-containing protein [Brucella pseudogrignonensis]MDR6431495.1 peptidoglycan hydrolase-like protein with peptidoglycan-binding domain [Brucella pseudogrignonensis]